MPSEPAKDQRLHPSSGLFIFIAAIRGVLIPLAAMLVFAGDSSIWLYVAGFAVIPAMFGFLFKYISFRYRLDHDEMVIRQGIVNKNERHIPYARIQNIDLRQNPLHRLFRVAEARLETASGGEPEAVIRVLSMEAVGELRRKVFADQAIAGEVNEAGVPVDAGPQAEVLFHMPPGEIVRYGLISNRGMVVVAAVFGLLYQTGAFGDEETGVVAQIVDRSIDQLSVGFVEDRAQQMVWVGAILVVLALIGVRLLSVALALVKLYGFTVTRRGDDLRTEYGLFTRVSATIPIHRIQSLTTRQGALHRLFRRTVIEVETAGGGGADGEEAGDQKGSKRQWIAPVIPEQRVAELVSQIMPEIDLAEPAWRSVEFRAWRRRIKPLVFLLLLMVGLLPWTLTLSESISSGMAWTWAGVGWMVGLPLVFLVSRRMVAAEGWAVSPQAVYYRSGVIRRCRSVVRFMKIQAVGMRQNPFDRRHRMARVRVDTAGASQVGHKVDIPYLACDTANDLMEQLYAEASRTGFRW